MVLPAECSTRVMPATRKYMNLLFCAAPTNWLRLAAARLGLPASGDSPLPHSIALEMSENGRIGEQVDLPDERNGRTGRRKHHGKRTKSKMQQISTSHFIDSSAKTPKTNLLLAGWETHYHPGKIQPAHAQPARARRQNNARAHSPECAARVAGWTKTARGYHHARARSARTRTSVTFSCA